VIPINGGRRPPVRTRARSETGKGPLASFSSFLSAAAVRLPGRIEKRSRFFPAAVCFEEVSPTLAALSFSRAAIFFCEMFLTLHKGAPRSPDPAPFVRLAGRSGYPIFRETGKGGSSTLCRARRMVFRWATATASG